MCVNVLLYYVNFLIVRYGMHMAVCVLCNYLYFCFKSYVWQTIILSMLYVGCIYIYVNKFEARSLFSTSHLKNEQCTNFYYISYVKSHK